MKDLRVDVAIIGAGTAGMSAYRAALAHTRSALVIEGGPYGTTCARVGCMPSKLLIAAADEGRIAGDNAGRFPHVRVRPRRAGLAVAFTDPQIMIAGRSHAELLRAGTDFEVGEVSFEDQGRSRVLLKNQGSLRIHGDRATGRFLGAEMIGPGAQVADPRTT